MRFDERAQHHTPGSDRVRDGRHVMAQPDSEEFSLTEPARVYVGVFLGPMDFITDRTGDAVV